MKIRLIWKDACSGAVRKPVLASPIALGSDFEQLPEKLGQRAVVRMAIADDQIQTFAALLMEEKGQLLLIVPKDPSQTMAEALRSPGGVAQAIQRQPLGNGDRFRLGTTELMVQIATASPASSPSNAPDPAAAFSGSQSGDEFSMKPTKLLDPELDEDEDMITANDVAVEEPNNPDAEPANKVGTKSTKLLDPRLDQGSEPDTFITSAIDSEPSSSAQAETSPATAATNPQAGAQASAQQRAGGFVGSAPQSQSANPAAASESARPIAHQSDADIAERGCDRSVGFLFKRRCGRFSRVDCPYCDRNRSGSGARNRNDDYDPYARDYIYYDHYGDYSQGHWGSDYYAERDRYYYDRNAGRMDFTEADAASFEEEFDKDYEMDMGAS